MELFFEPATIKPIFQDSIVRLMDGAKNERIFRVDRWFRGKQHCYIFVCVSGHNIYPFAKKASDVKEIIENKKLIIEKL